MGGLQTCGKCLLIGFNIFWTIIGFVLLAVGTAVKFIPNILDMLFAGLKQAASQAGGSASAAIKLADEGTAEFLKFADRLAIPLIVIGVFLFLVGIFGCCGACYQNKILLIIYACIVGLFILGEIISTIVIVAMKDKVKASLKLEFVKYIDKYYDDSATDLGSVIMNVGMTMGQCCGFDGYADFQNCKNWKRTRTVNGVTRTMVIPVACCKLKNPLTSAAIPKESDFVDVMCVVTPTTVNSNYVTGCWIKVEEAVKANLPWAITILVLFLLLQILLFACAVMMIRDKD